MVVVAECDRLRTMVTPVMSRLRYYAEAWMS